MTATRTPELYTCTCDLKPQPHLFPAQRVLVDGLPDVDPQQVHDALTGMQYEFYMAYGHVPLIVVMYDGEATATVEAAREWASSNGTPFERRDDESFSERLMFVRPADRPVWGAIGPVERRRTHFYDVA
ncbi:hypothetical protein ABT224_33320 [Streptomyces sp. NPDC001584]|uniref:hypothetical protein n=1 Tax=Streptomyces sp. NPDC001584 TaxID=3154521 RepID=UPI0033292E6D